MAVKKLILENVAVSAYMGVVTAIEWLKPIKFEVAVSAYMGVVTSRHARISIVDSAVAVSAYMGVVTEENEVNYSVAALQSPPTWEL